MKGLQEVTPPTILSYPTIEESKVPLLLETVQVVTRHYMGLRAVERAILHEPPQVPHRENDAEHSWHITDLVDNICVRHEELGINLGPGFSLLRTLRMAHHHDAHERLAGDVDAMTSDTNLLNEKDQRECAGIETMAADPILYPAGDTVKEYHRKDTPESGLVNDCDKAAPIEVIVLDGGRIWLNNFSGGQTELDFMLSRQRAKMVTPLGHVTLDYIGNYLEGKPELFPAPKRLF